MERPVARRKICENDVKKEEKCWKLVDKNIAIYRPAFPPPGFESSGRSVENARKMYCDECKWRTLKARGLEKWSDHGTE